MKLYDIFSKPHIAYTIGRCDIYDNQKSSLTLRKVGYIPSFFDKDKAFYVGGAVWETFDQAKNYLYCDPNYAVYKLLLPAEFNKCIVTGSYKFLEGSRLLYDALILGKANKK
jgi:hypothetical protein